MASKTSDPSAKTAIKKESLNIYQKLVMIREEFAASEVSKSGINTHAECEYFELFDIIPVATPILTKYNALFLSTFPAGQAVGRLINLDNTEEFIEFVFDTLHIKDPSKFRMNEAQACGAEQTYYRRYLYFQLLDMAPGDTFDGSKAPVPPPAPPTTTSKSKKPATTEERAEVKKNLTDTEGKADELQIKALKEALKNLREIDPSQEEFIQTIAIKTEGFKKISRAACETLILHIREMQENYFREQEDQLWNG